MGLLFHLGLSHPKPSSTETAENDLFVILSWISFCIFFYAKRMWRPECNMEQILRQREEGTELPGSAQRCRTRGFSPLSQPHVGGHVPGSEWRAGAGRGISAGAGLRLEGVGTATAQMMFPAGRMLGKLITSFSNCGLCLQA